MKTKHFHIFATMKTKNIYNSINSLLPKVLGVFLLLSIFTLKANAQVYYYYDDNGNRIASSATPPEHAPRPNNDKKKVVIYPNPNTGVVNVGIASLDKCAYATIYILDQSGNIMSTQKATSTVTSVNLTSYQQGTYYLKTVLCDEQYSFRIVKMNPGASPTAPQHPTAVKY